VGFKGEVRALLNEVGDLREWRRALYLCVRFGNSHFADGLLRELADLLLMKGRQSQGLVI